MSEVEVVPARVRNIPTSVRRAVEARDGFTCQLCLTDLEPGTHHLDHIVPWASGGESTTDNLRVACAPCNLRRPRPQVPVRRIDRPGAPVVQPFRVRQRLARKDAGPLSAERLAATDALIAAGLDARRGLSHRQRRAWGVG